MENNEIFKKSVAVHKRTDEKKEEPRKKLKDESFSMDEMESYELKRYMLLKKEIIGVKKSMYLGIALLGFVAITVVSVLIFSFGGKNSDVNTAEWQKYEKNMFEYVKSEFNEIKERQKVLAKNQKLLNAKILALNNYQEMLSNELKSKIDTIYTYLKNQGKITEVLANIIVEDSVKLDKILELKVNEIRKKKETENNGKTNEGEKTSTNIKKVKEEIKQKSQGLIDKYKVLLQQLQ